MAKERKAYVCQQCGTAHPRWQGKCDGCAAWNTLVEERAARDLANATHPYTRGLLRSLPRIDETRAELPTLQRDPSWLEG